ncbi:hypothetical protein EGH21_04535 [Halomicroarcula sp. F13]|uniref:Halobacterial output domain-containing protein n=1 Tax=Haloarcula rubra TaxID=2487747 RepID=A0AAW4PNM8_9EURY|nr:HalOD1 output domain-containing protein [Halomicroarcula rubra]MBX0322299.1 hypothetical protein [Halomicroarcula rubra]
MHTTPDAAATTPDLSTTVDQTDSVAETVVRAVAAVEDDPVEALPPLTTAVDPDALAALFGTETVGHVSFTYYGHTVVVSSADDVAVY